MEKILIRFYRPSPDGGQTKGAYLGEGYQVIEGGQVTGFVNALDQPLKLPKVYECEVVPIVDESEDDFGVA